MKKILFKILACPDCHKKVIYSEKDKQFLCPSCSKIFNVQEDCPVLFSKYSKSIEISGKDFYEDKDSTVKDSLTKRFARRIVNLSGKSMNRTLHDKLRDEYIFNSPREALILNLGSGTENIMQKDNLINLDVYPHKNTDVSGDGHYLPFKSDSFDGVWVCAALEHLKNPFQIASEIYRVQKPGGFVLVSAPFIYHLHGSPYDYFRYTDSGIESVFKEFKKIECGPTHTLPTGTLIEVISQYFSIFTNNKKFAFGIKYFIKLLLWPLRILDFYLQKKTKAKTLSGGFAFLGKKEIS